jgi:SAM-dependent methyltransferase
VVGQPISEDRLKRCFRGKLAEVKNQLVLEAGSGAGRFTEIFLKYGARIHSFDYSDAVEANAGNIGNHANLSLAQADIRAIPYPKESYDFVVCLGVLQHTPSPEESIEHLWEMVKPGGHLIIDHYRFKLRNVLPPPIGGAEVVYRWLLLLSPKELRLKIVKGIVDFWFPIHWRLRNMKFMQQVLRRLSPVHFYYPLLPLGTRERFLEWAYLDTHDGTTDYFKHHRSVGQIRRILETFGAEDIICDIGGNGVEAICRKPAQRC